MYNTNPYNPEQSLLNFQKYKHDIQKTSHFDTTHIKELGLDILKQKYCSKEHNETSIEDCISRIALTFMEDYESAKKIYKYICNGFFIPATPIWANGGLLDRGIPISCYLNESGSSVQSKIQNINENIFIANNWGGIGTLLDGVHSQELMPYCKMLESLNFAFYNNDRKSSAAVYLSIDHCGIEEFLEMRRPIGGDHRIKCLHLHHGIIIPDKFFDALKNKTTWSLYENNGQWVKDVDPLLLWNRIIKIRFETGEPYLLFIDRLKEQAPEFHKIQGMEPKTSNLCSEITLFTSEERTAVCCLGSLNLFHYEQWKNDPEIIELCLRFLDNVLTYTSHFFKHLLPRATHSIVMENAVGLGVMGFHSLLQEKNIAIESQEAAIINEEIFAHIKNQGQKVSKKLAIERGACKDAQNVNDHNHRFSYMLAIAPTATISYVGGCSPAIEPYMSNIMTIRNGMGNYNYLNPHLLKVLNKNTLFLNDKDFQEKILKDIYKNQGSVKNLDILDEQTKNTFKTAFEIDQNKLVELAGARQKYICQSQSLNLFFSSDTTGHQSSKVLIGGWKNGIKSYYYSRIQPLLKAEGSETNINLEELNENYKQSMDFKSKSNIAMGDIICEGCI